MEKSANSASSTPQIEGLPDGAEVAGDRVFFVYRRKAELTETFDEDFFEKRFKTEMREERDEIGVVKNGEFLPNDYFQKWHPTAKERPAHRWKNAFMRQKAYCRRYANWDDYAPKLTPRVAADYDVKDARLESPLSVGFSGFAADELWTSGAAEALACGAFEGDAGVAADLMNLVLGFWPEAALVPLFSEDVTAIHYNRLRQRCIGEAPMPPVVRPLLSRIGARTGFLKRFADARADAAAARDTMVLIDGPRGIAVRTAIDDPEILAIHAFERPKRWTRDLLRDIIIALNAPEDPVYCLRGTLDAADYFAVKSKSSSVFAEALWPSPVIEGFKKEFKDALLLERYARRGKPAAAVSVPGALLGNKSSWFQYTIIRDEYRGSQRFQRTLNRCEKYAADARQDPGLPCPMEVAPWITRSPEGEIAIENDFKPLAESWGWEVIAGPRDDKPFDEVQAARLWKTAESLREPLADMMECLEKSAGVVFTDEVTPEREAATAAAALGAVVVAKFRRQSKALEFVVNQFRYRDNDALGDADIPSRLLQCLRDTTLEAPDRWAGSDIAELCARSLEEIDNQLGYALGMSGAYFDSTTGLMDKLSPAFLTDVAQRFADPANPQPPAPYIRDPECFSDPATLERLDEFFVMLGRSPGKKPLCTLFMWLADAVKAHWGATAETIAKRLAKEGIAAEDADRMAKRLQEALICARRFGDEMKTEPLSLKEATSRLYYAKRFVLESGTGGMCESIQIFLSALACAIELIPVSQVKEAAVVLARFAHELAHRHFVHRQTQLARFH